MVKLEECVIPQDDHLTRVYYQNPAELRSEVDYYKHGGHDFHHGHEDHEHHHGYEDHHGHHDDFHHGHDEHHHGKLDVMHDDDHEFGDPNYTPIDAFNKIYQDPKNVNIANYNDKYYIDHKDLKCYMDACKNKDYGNAIENIVNAYDDPKLCVESVRVFLKESELKLLSNKDKVAMNNSNVNFEVYR